MHDIDAYWQDGLPNIEGWVNERWLPFLKLIDQVQAGLGVTGHAAEIGVFHGKLLIALAHLMQPFLYCAHKMFFAGHGWHADFLRACTDHFGGQADAKMTQMFGHPVLSIFP